MRSPSFTLLTLAVLAAFLGLPFQVVQAQGAGASDPIQTSAAFTDGAPAPVSPGAQVGDVEGQGWAAILSCVGCLVGAGIVLSNGITAVIAAIAAEGSALAAAGCILVCSNALAS
ncbi:MAG: hypothetical protein RQ751_02275 [Longimicrobiales bacterium]|nr:hypothetical protein [Longimicrobiales bacterium]